MKKSGKTTIFITTRTQKIQFSPEWLNISDQEVFNNTIRQVASNENVILIDLDSHMKQDVSDFKNTPVKYLYDGMHVTDIGSTKYARFISDRLKLILKK